MEGLTNILKVRKVVKTTIREHDGEHYPCEAHVLSIDHGYGEYFNVPLEEGRKYLVVDVGNASFRDWTPTKKWVVSYRNRSGGILRRREFTSEREAKFWADHKEFRSFIRGLDIRVYKEISNSVSYTEDVDRG